MIHNLYVNRTAYTDTVFEAIIGGTPLKKKRK